ncbi:MAG TPA: ATP-dependent zinc metalloprotease FtsH [Chloroflexi bacterium]|nr:ATP-dependent zinc metalloprotease FtsH [Chloroflexota bacterium]
MKKNNRPLNNSLIENKLLRIAILVAALIITGVALWLPTFTTPKPITLTDLANDIRAGEVVTIQDTTETGELLITYRDGSTEKSMRDTASSLLEQLNHLGLEGEHLSAIKLEFVRSKGLIASRTLSTVISLAMVGVMGFVALRVLNKGPMGEKKFTEGEIPDLNFSDVAGMEENIQEIQDIVTFLKEGNKYADMGAKMPRGILLVGDPGTGKTLLAKALAGEARVPFFAMSGSEFVEVFVGVGASRIRSLFKKARAKAPCIIFIDEIDAVGRERHGSGGGAEAEQDQTLNQLLVEMDGFGSQEGIIVLAATNRVDVLDPALLRPGRFDRRITVGRPDVKGREEILKVHVQGKKLAADVDLMNVAKATPGLVGADLANIVNEAAILAVRNNHLAITMQDFEEAVEKNIAGGVQRKNRVMSDEERRIVAYHEAGHAVAIHETRLSDPVYKITIIPRGQAGGYTMSLPEQDTMLMSKNKILARIIGLMGGRAAEEIFFQDITSGASNDLQMATQLAEEMVMRLGMDSATGLRVFPQPQGYAALAAPRTAQKTFESIDESVKNILDSCYEEAKNIISTRRNAVERVADELLEVETINRERFLELMEAEPVLA